MAISASWLADRGVVRVSGPEAASFLQGVLTQDVETLAPLQARYGALLTPQGKILFDFLVVRMPGAEPAFALDCPAPLAPELARRLSFYKLRAKATIADESADHGIVAYGGDEPEMTAGAIVYLDPRDPRLGHREILPRAKAVAIGEAGLADGRLLVVDAATGMQQHLAARRTEPLAVLAYSPTGRWLAAGCDDGGIDMCVLSPHVCTAAPPRGP